VGYATTIPKIDFFQTSLIYIYIYILYILIIVVLYILIIVVLILLIIEVLLLIIVATIINNYNTKININMYRLRNLATEKANR
jgi:hypothetical protein